MLKVQQVVGLNNLFKKPLTSPLKPDTETPLKGTGTSKPAPAKFSPRIFLDSAVNLKGVIFVISMFFISCISLWFTVYLITKDRIYPDISISGVEIGGLTKNSAQRLLTNKIKPQENISLTIDGKLYQIISSDIELIYNYGQTVEYAYFYKRSSNIFRNLFNSLWIFGPKTDFPIALSFNKDKLVERLELIKREVDVVGESPSINVTNKQIEVNPGKDGKYLSIDDIIKNLEIVLGQNKQPLIEARLLPIKKALDADGQKGTFLRAQKLLDTSITMAAGDYKKTITGEEIVSYIDFPDGFKNPLIASLSSEIAQKIQSDPQDSVFVFENGKVEEFSPSKDGMSLDLVIFNQGFSELLNNLYDSTENVFDYNIPVITTKPKITTESVNNMGIKEIIGKGSSRFRGSIASRIHNIGLASDKINGVLVAPEEVFSFNKALGDVSSSTGFQQAYIIKDNQTVLGDGGGVCQVSTTLFRAILNAGLPILERASHSYRVYYYEQDSPPGMDATVYEPSPDLKFKNDTGSYLLIQAVFNKRDYSLSFELYGLSDGRVSIISKPQITNVTPPPDDLYVDDPGLPTGTVKQVETKAWGAKVVFNYSVTKAGNEIYSKTFVSNYRPWQAKYLKGTKVL